MCNSLSSVDMRSTSCLHMPIKQLAIGPMSSLPQLNASLDEYPSFVSLIAFLKYRLNLRKLFKNYFKNFLSPTKNTSK